MFGNMSKKNLIVLKNQDKILRLCQLKINAYLQRTATHSMWIYKTLSAHLYQQPDKVAHLTFLIVVKNNYAIFFTDLHSSSSERITSSYKILHLPKLGALPLIDDFPLHTIHIPSSPFCKVIKCNTQFLSQRGTTAHRT